MGLPLLVLSVSLVTRCLKCHLWPPTTPEPRSCLAGVTSTPCNDSPFLIVLHVLSSTVTVLYIPTKMVLLMATRELSCWGAAVTEFNQNLHKFPKKRQLTCWNSAAVLVHPRPTAQSFSTSQSLFQKPRDNTTLGEADPKMLPPKVSGLYSSSLII